MEIGPFRNFCNIVYLAFHKKYLNPQIENKARECMEGLKISSRSVEKKVLRDVEVSFIKALKGLEKRVSTVFNLRINPLDAKAKEIKSTLAAKAALGSLFDFKLTALEQKERNGVYKLNLPLTDFANQNLSQYNQLRTLAAKFQKDLKTSFSLYQFLNLLSQYDKDIKKIVGNEDDKIKAGRALLVRLQGGTRFVEAVKEASKLLKDLPESIRHFVEMIGSYQERVESIYKSQDY